MPWNLIGAGRAIESLKLMMESGRLPHALLFTGAKGSGKNTLARALAKAVNCASLGPDGGPCGQCLSCCKVEKDLHPDVKTFVPEGAANVITVKTVQALRAEMAFRPFEGRVKVFIVREVERFSSDSGNALLKTLEEPPPDSLLILTGASEAEIMETIVSRCLRLKLPPLSQNDILRTLEDKRGLNGDKARLLAALSGGALGPALELEPEDMWAKWLQTDAIMAASTAAERLNRAWAWVKSTLEAKEEKNVFSAYMSILALWWRETVRLYASENIFLEGPSPREGQLIWAERLTEKSIKTINKAGAKLEDSLARFIKAELAFENYWLSVLGV